MCARKLNKTNSFLNRCARKHDQTNDFSSCLNENAIKPSVSHYVWTKTQKTTGFQYFKNFVQALYQRTLSKHFIPALHQSTLSKHLIHALYPSTLSTHFIQALYPRTFSKSILEIPRIFVQLFYRGEVLRCILFQGDLWDILESVWESLLERVWGVPEAVLGCVWIVCRTFVEGKSIVQTNTEHW